MFLFLFKCLTPDIALSVLDEDGKEYLTKVDYQRISTVLLYYVINLRDLCVSNAASSSSLSSSTSLGNYHFYVLALTNLHPGEDSHFLSAGETESILQLINQHYHPTNEKIPSDQQVGLFKRDLLCHNGCTARYEHFTFDPTVYRYIWPL